MDWSVIVPSGVFAAVVSGLVAVFLNIANHQSLLAMIELYEKATRKGSKLKGKNGDYLDDETRKDLLCAIQQQAKRKAVSFYKTETKRRIPIYCIICFVLCATIGGVFVRIALGS